MVYLIVFVGFLVGVLFIYGSFYILAADRLKLEERLFQISTHKDKNKDLDELLQRPFVERVIKPLLNWFAYITKKFTPAKKRDNLEKKLVLAGNPGNLSASEFLSLHYFIAVLLGGAGLGISITGQGDSALRILYPIWGLVFGFVLVNFYLKARIKNRRDSMAKDLPDVLDLLTVSVEAGLGFDAALQRVVQKTKGPISIEFNKTLQEIKMGKPRRDALRDLANRTSVDDLNTFISAIIQADQLGVSIGNILKVQSGQMRLLRRQRIEEKAMKAPIKMLLPMVFFIFPTIFIVLLGPAAIQVMEQLLQ